MAGRVGEHGYDFVHLVDGAGPAVGDDDGHRVGALALFVDEMDALPVNGGIEIGEGVEPGFGGAPVKSVPPVGYQFLDVVQVGAVVPPGAGDFVGPAHVGQPMPQVGKRVVGNADGVGLYRHSGTSFGAQSGGRSQAQFSSDCGLKALCGRCRRGTPAGSLAQPPAPLDDNPPGSAARRRLAEPDLASARTAPKPAHCRRTANHCKRNWSRSFWFSFSTKSSLTGIPGLLRIAKNISSMLVER